MISSVYTIRPCYQDHSVLALRCCLGGRTDGLLGGFTIGFDGGLLDGGETGLLCGVVGLLSDGFTDWVGFDGFPPV